MKYKHFKSYKLLIVFMLAMVASILISLGNFIIPILALFVAAAFLFLLSRRVKEVVTDERINSISGKAARIAYTSITLSIAILSLIFIALGKKYPEYTFTGNILAFLACIAMMIYIISFKIYSKS